MANYADEVLNSIRALVGNSGLVLPPPGAARAAARSADVVIDPAIAARAAGRIEPDFAAGSPLWRDMDDASTVQRNVTLNRERNMNNTFPIPDAQAGPTWAAPAGPNMDLGTPLFDQMSKSAGAFDNTLRGRTANLRNQPFAKPAQAAIKDANDHAAKMRAAMEASAERGEVMRDVGAVGAMGAGALAAGAGAYALTGAGKAPAAKADPPAPPPAPAKPAKSADDPLFQDAQPLTSTGGTAELANESRPVPAVPASTDPRAQAQELIAKLNKMRRDAGGEVPEAKEMMAEINRLMALSNQSRNAMTPQQAQGSDDPHSQAQALIAQLNDMRRKAGGEVPQAQQIMAEVRRLQAMGDQQRNAAQTR